MQTGPTGDPWLCLTLCRCIYSTQKTSISRIIRSIFNRLIWLGYSSPAVKWPGYLVSRHAAFFHTEEYFSLEMRRQSKGWCWHSRMFLLLFPVWNKRSLTTEVFLCLSRFSIKATFIITPPPDRTTASVSALGGWPACAFSDPSHPNPSFILISVVKNTAHRWGSLIIQVVSQHQTCSSGAAFTIDLVISLLLIIYLLLAQWSRWIQINILNAC